MSDIVRVTDLVGRKFPVLNHGHIVLMDWMGDDAAVLEAARTAYQKGTKQVSDDRTLLRYLFRHRHTSPFESCVIKLHVKLPIFVERQWARHRTAGWNEVSARYSELPEEYYVADIDTIRQQSTTNKQGRGERADYEDAVEFNIDTRRDADAAFETYHKRLGKGVARELARINLPVGTYTEKVWWINLQNMIHFLGLRMDKHAQWEIRQYANIIGEQIISVLFPNTWQAFLDYRLNAETLSALDIAVIRDLMARAADGLRPPFSKLVLESSSHLQEALPEEWRNALNTGKKVCREFDEFCDKAKRLGIVE